MSDRDYLADMNAAIEEAVPDGDYAAPVVAAELVAHLRETDPELLAGWLDLRAEIYVADMIARRSNSKRQTARHLAPRRAFAEAAWSFESSGEAVVLKPFAFEYVVDAANTRRKVGAMTAADCLFVAGRYEDTARSARLEASFQRAVAKKIGRRTVGEVFSEEQYLTMYQSITGQAPGSAAA
jgi:hypothetical protein